MDTWSRRSWEKPNNWARVKGAARESASRYELIGRRDEVGSTARLPAERIEAERAAGRCTYGRWDI